ncbi:MAG TPA: hypothetical protein VNJ01_15060 [Bacteriovoracaceae bacterium]|nr:hypothetical protein [Bacteriovoracaceae bacterium]
MKLIFTLSLLISLSGHAQIIKNTSNLFLRAKADNKGKTPALIVEESLAHYEKFVALNVNSPKISTVYLNDKNKPRKLSLENGQKIIDASIINPVVSSTPVVDYDPEKRGIGYCFGRAMFSHLYLMINNFNRSNIKKAFIIGPMGKGVWAWHMVTIAQSADPEGKEIWLALDPNFGRPVELKEWYNHWLTTSDNGKLRLYITESSKFAVSAFKYNEATLANKFYHGYFLDMREWFDDNDISRELIFERPSLRPRLSPAYYTNNTKSFFE